MISFKLLEHPSDIGIEGTGSTLSEAFASAAAGLVSIFVDPTSVRPVFSRTVEIEADDTQSLLVRWLNEIIYLFDAEHFIVCSADIGLLEVGRLSATLHGEPLSPGRHALRTDVKAATFHQLSIIEKTGECVVRIYVDI